jgi:glucan phosphoethanolaminetransferase (alkaline phosphatase superfamily)
MQESSRHQVWFSALLMAGLFFAALQLWRLYFLYCNHMPLQVKIFTSGWRLDISMVCGVLLISGLPFWMINTPGTYRSNTLMKTLLMLIWLFISVTEISSALLYPEWGSTVDARAVSYLTHPREVWASVSSYLPFIPVFIGSFFLMGGLVLIHFFSDRLTHISTSHGKRYLELVVIIILAVSGLRGGLQKLPVTPSDAFKSPDMKENFASVNKEWYFIYSVLHQHDLKTASSDEAIENFRQRYMGNSGQAAHSQPDWKNKNIVLIVLEGWSSDLVSYLGGQEAVTPFFDSIAQHSVVFTDMYAAGFRTDQGILAILSGIPSMGGENLLNNATMVSNFPSLPALLRKRGYKTSFFYGGDMNFANLDFYIHSLGFDMIQGGADFSDEEKSTEWGVPDHIVLANAAAYMRTSASPFFSTVLLLSSHAPFDVPWQNSFMRSDDIPSRYKASVHYSDQSLRNFFRSIEGTAWLDNTIFVITTDHGSVHSGSAGLEDPERFRIPAIVYEPGKSKEGMTVMGTIANQADLPLSVATAAGLEHADFPFSRNMLDADTSRIACWSTDVYAACTHDLLPASNSSKHLSNEAVLFQDMIRKWLNR